MSDVKVNVSDFMPDFLKLMEVSDDVMFSNTLGALRQIAIMYQSVWRKYASGEMVVEGKPPIHSRGNYTRSIQIDDSVLSNISIYTDFKYHDSIEKGHPAIDLKRGLLSGPKARMGKNGPYNIVPFRHGVPGSSPYHNNPMSERVYNLIKGITDEADAKREQGLSNERGTSTVTGMQRVQTIEAGKKVTKTKLKYAWGKSISKLDTEGKRRRKDTGYTHKSGKYAGMYRMQASSSRAKSSKYMTFRIVSYRSDPQSWIVPERPPIPIRQATVDFVRPYAEELILNAIEKDIS